MMRTIFALLAVAASASATVLWDGRFNAYTTSADFNQWSWSNQVGTYQTYIYGNLHGETASSWLTLGSTYKNPATTAEKQGIKIKINSTSTWNGGPMLRTEILPQTTNSLTGHLYFHVSLQIPTVNPPDPAYEHQIVFWESHVADIKYGQLTGQNGVADTLQVITGGKSVWSVTPAKGTWYNFILETGSPGGLWVSTGSAPLTKVYTGSLGGSGGTAWHVGALRLPLNGVTQQITETDFYYSGIYVEDSGPTTQP
ncbi:glycoside hydrolase family 131 protein [Phanerochaete sordida]|uniref:Glycoside hydrolase family 131 protein n=1 Tax=Phanerochaete sordida TaxID=48140 RepID=A0A9P3G140_9APHY|nr:glycoside hydrolase family 131 protein [Phanerochaete sordida]